jgi:hypothetical protein
MVLLSEDIIVMRRASGRRENCDGSRRGHVASPRGQDGDRFNLD